MKAKLASLLVLTSLFILGCQAEPKLPVPRPNPPVAAVQQNPDAYTNQRITWGGVILTTAVKEKGTEITILAKRLDRETRPIKSDTAPGRFIANINGFIDPAVYAAGREISINGVVVGADTRKVGEFDYHYPVIDADSHYLWPVRTQNNDDFYYRDPWYDPWYYPYPYYYNHHPHKTIKKVN